MAVIEPKRKTAGDEPLPLWLAQLIEVAGNLCLQPWFISHRSRTIDRK